MNKIYAEMMQMFKEKGEVIMATELAPQCGKKYLYRNGFAYPPLANITLTDIPATVACGQQEFFIEQLAGAPELILVGGGHVALAVAKIAKMVGFKVSVIDDRLAFANQARFPEAEQILCMDIEAGLQKSFGTNAYYVIVTRGHKDDLRALETVLKKPHRYAGMIGSRKKVAYTMEQLREKGYEDDVLRAVHAPIGLRIGAITPEEIAVSIMGEIIMVMNTCVNDKHQSDILTALLAEDEAMAMVTIIEKKGSSPRGVGCKMLVSQSGKITGTIGGGAIEYHAAKRAAQIAVSGGAEIKEYDVSLNDASQLGMACGGSVKVLIESTEI